MAHKFKCNYCPRELILICHNCVLALKYGEPTPNVNDCNIDYFCSALCHFESLYGRGSYLKMHAEQPDLLKTLLADMRMLAANSADTKPAREIPLSQSQ